MSERIQAFYRDNPLMVSSPFGGVAGVHRDLAKSVFSKLDIAFGGKLILDVGCGRGFMSEIVRDGGGTYLGADLLPNGAGFPLVQADAMQLPFRDASVDGVFCIDAFEHIPDGAGAAREFRRVLRPGGFMFLSAPNYGNVAGMAKWWYEFTGRYEKNTWAPFRRWQPQELEQPLTTRGVISTFRSAGFGRVARIGHAAEFGLGVFPWVDHPRMPERIQYRLQDALGAVAPVFVRLFPGSSLHQFWKFTF